MMNKQFNMTIAALLSVLMLFAGSSQAERRNPQKDPLICGRPQCSQVNNKFAYNSTARYRYEYEMHVRTEFSGSGQNTSDVYVTAKLILSFPKRCEGLLTISDVVLRDEAVADAPLVELNENAEYYDDAYDTVAEAPLHPKSGEFANAITKNTLRFSFHDGVISEICPTEEEDNWILNFKKGILSAIQNSMSRFDIDHNSTETDVTGKCDVTYRMAGSKGTSLLLQKTKDIKSCTKRYKTNSILQTVPYDFRQDFAMWPILKSSSKCNITVDHNIYQEVSCFERHQLVPLSNNQSGAVTESRSRLKLVDESTFEAATFYETPEITTRSTLLFNHYATAKPTHGEIKTSRELLKQMCTLGFPDIQRDFIDVFTRFLQTTRLLSQTALHELLTRASSICRAKGKNHVLESLPYIGSTAAVQIMRDQIVNRAVPSDVVQAWLSSLAYLPRPDEEILNVLHELLTFGLGEATNPKYVLTSTAVAHTFCRNHPDCWTSDGIQKILEFLENDLIVQLQDDITKRHVRERIIVLLKGIGNVGEMTTTLNQQLQALIENQTMPIEVRLQSIYAHTRFNCESLRDYFLDLYEEFSENSEIRIASYLQSMRCPDYRSMKRIKDVLTVEPINQVGSYVWSHLTNLAKSASPVNIETQSLLVDEYLGNKYKLDIRKFSRNFDHSLFFDEYNFGTRSDANLIFGTESYLPRQIGLNFTVELFGEAVNLFEITARMEGFDQMVESLFGPKGPGNPRALREKFSFLSTLWADTVHHVNPEDLDYLEKFTFRSKRDANISGSPPEMANPLQKLQSSIANVDYKLKYKFDEPRASLDLKMFGNDIQYTTVEGQHEFSRAMNGFNPLQRLQELFSGKEINYTKSGVFLDVSYEVPLLCGIPLSIHAFGASSIDLRMWGALKDTNFLTTKRLDIAGKVKPSVSVDVIATMQSDFFYGASGIRVKSNLYSSSSIDAKVQVNGMKVGNVQFSLPKERNDIFSARSELFVLKYDKEIPQKGIAKRYANSTCTWPFIDRAVGLQICSEYSLPDVNNATVDYPSLLLSGPIALNIRLDKADVSAKTFTFEYNWNTMANQSSGSFLFHTPDSVIPRVFIANVTSDPANFNLSMHFRNGALVHSAVAIFKNTSDELKVEASISMDGSKNFAFEMGVNISEVKYGWIYYPKMILTINRKDIAGLSGTLKSTNKKNIIQHSIDIKFETIQFKTRLEGTCTQTIASTTTKLTANYQFVGTKEERVEFESELADRSQKNRNEHDGLLKVKSSAYPHYNFGAGYKFTRVLGHMDATLTFNNGPDLVDPRYATSMRIVLALAGKDDKNFIMTRSMGSIEITRPMSNVDVRLQIKHEVKLKNGSEHNVLVSLRLAPKKEATAALSLLQPHGPFYTVDAVLNITVPSFDSLTVALRVVERASNDYKINFKGSWFSGHSVTVDGFYQDKTTFVKISHHLKILANGTLFNATNVDARFWRDQTELSVDVQVDHGSDRYGVQLKQSDRDETKRTLNAALQIRDQHYSVLVNTPNTVPRQLKIEIHLDNFRDIHLELIGQFNTNKKEAGIVILYDANRDPTQKLAITGDFNHRQPKIYDGTFLVAYPERTFSGSFDMLIGPPQYNGTFRVGWSSHEFIEISIDVGAMMAHIKDVWAHIGVLTPFDGWHTNALDVGFYLSNNRLLANGSLAWADDQHLGTSLISDYVHTDVELELEFKVELNSTIKDVPTVSAYFKHSHTQKRLDTDLHVRHLVQGELPNLFLLRSGWQYDVDLKHQNVTGSMVLRSPLDGYKTGALSTKFSLSNKKQIRGGADLDIEERKYTLLIDGHVKKLTENMLMVNVTTPLEKFRKIFGRFGINEHDRHVVAEVRSPGAALGIELKWAVITMSDFDVKFSLETPSEAFQKVILVGKMKPDTVAFQGGLNRIMLGYVGVWRFVNTKDFMYSYKVYTPLEHFEENGFVVKNKFIELQDFEVEMSVKFSKYKLGIVTNAKPRPPLMWQLGVQRAHALIKSQLLNDDEFFRGTNGSEEDTEDDEDEDEEDGADLLNFVANMELDTLRWPTIYGTLDLEEINEIYYAHGILKIPHGEIQIRDRLEVPDYFNVENTLKVDTPYEDMKIIKSRYRHTYEPGALYGGEFNVEILRHQKWMETGIEANYTKNRQDQLKNHDIQLQLKTPFAQMKSIIFRGLYEEEVAKVYRTNVTLKTGDTAVSVAGSYESEVDFFDLSMGLNLVAPSVPRYACRVFYKKDLSDVQDTLDFGFELHENETSTNLNISAAWHLDSSNYLRTSCKIHTNLIAIQVWDAKVLLTRRPHQEAVVDVVLTSDKQETVEFHAMAMRKNKLVVFEMKTPFQGFDNVQLEGSLTPSDNRFLIQGRLSQSTKMYNVDGNLQFSEDVPVLVALTFRPMNEIGNAGELYFAYNDVKKEETGGIVDSGMAGGFGRSMKMEFRADEMFVNVSADLNVHSKVHWKSQFVMLTSKGLLSKAVDGNRVNLLANVSTSSDGLVMTNLAIATPWKHLGIGSIMAASNVSLASKSGQIHGTYELHNLTGTNSYSWAFNPLDHIQIGIDNVAKRGMEAPRIFQAGFKYLNNANHNSVTRKPQDIPRLAVTMSTTLNIDKRWWFESNKTLTTASGDYSATLSVRMPNPIGDLHRIDGRFKGTLENITDNVSYEIRYDAEESRSRFASRGQYRNVDDMQGVVRAEWGDQIGPQVVEANMQMLRKGVRRELSARVVTPLHAEDTLSGSGSYDLDGSKHLIAGRVFYPASNQIAVTEVTFASLSNLQGHLNCSTPFTNLTWVHGGFNFSTTGHDLVRYIKGTWPKDWAEFDLRNRYTSQNLDRDVQGTVKMEIPLATRHYANIGYGMKERANVKTGHCVVDYNRRKMLDGQYSCKTESRAGYDKDVVDITIVNDMKPIGISFVHVFEQSSGIDGPLYDMKRAEIFDLKNSKLFNITGEFHLRTTMTGQEYKIVAIHPNRTVVLTSDYDFQEKTTKTNSKLQLAQDVWISYNVMVENKTQGDNESQSFSAELAYPKRNLSTEGWYSVTENAFDSDLSFKWTVAPTPSDESSNDDYNYDTNDNDGNPREMRAIFNWRNEPLRRNEMINQSATLTIRHPSFEKDVTLKAQYFRSLVDLFRAKFEADYCFDPDHFVNFEAVAQDLSNTVGYRNYSFNVVGLHLASEVILNANGSVGVRPGLYEAGSLGEYKRGYLPLQEGSLVAVLNMRTKELRYLQISPSKTVHVWSHADGQYPLFELDGLFEDSPEVNYTGRFFVNMLDKEISLNVNLTQDAKQNVHMYGVIQDSRGASFDLWRDYDEIRVVDISYYLRMNHSRLVTSQLLWRPNMRNEIKARLKENAISFYDAFADTADFWVKTIYTESREIVDCIWQTSKPYTQLFLDDVGGLQALEGDIEDFRKFLNQSYEANDFYIKNVVNFTLTVLDELSLKNHIDSVPKILSEMWQILGASGQALHKSVLWLVDTIKTSYNRAIEMIGRLFHGEAIIQISDLLEKGVAQYDRVVKDMHLSFIKYVEKVWNKLSDSVINYWKRSLERIEPSLLKFFHYVESVTWNVLSEVMDFLYKRTNEMSESPYFTKVSNFTQDMDRLYRDVTTNDILTNIRKYSAVTWHFITEKYFKYVPFSKEMSDVMTELVSEIKKLYRLEAVQFVGEKLTEIRTRLEWVANEFQLEKRVHQLWQIIRNKIDHYAQTALQSDDKYREAKTKFVFDPDVGVVQLEQKLPMSWHAFNETPIFEEINEYKWLLYVQNQLASSNATLLSLYHEYRPYFDISTWFPPYKAHSLLIGSRHYMTFDKQIVSIRSQFERIDSDRKPAGCSYLLAHDFLNRNFTLVLEPSITKSGADLISSRKLSLISDGTVLDIDIIGSAIRVGRNLTTTLPIRIGETVVYREADILLVESGNGFLLSCNLQFDLCWFEVSGWYFGRTGGLLGNMNNEGYDDFNGQQQQLCKTDEELLDSWSLDSCTPVHNVIEQNATEEVLAACDSFFRRKTSYFDNCFAVVDPIPFYEMCLDMGMNSFMNAAQNSSGHPAAKNGLCTIALAYIESCAAAQTLLRIPETCIFCDLVNGSYVKEGEFLELRDADVPQTSDVVFIVEAKPCNKDITTTKSIVNLVNVLNKELIAAGITQNRYAVIAFGGAAPFDRPRTIVHNNQIFTDHTLVPLYFNHIRTGKSNNTDIFEAISTALALIFRPGASKTFILLSCSSCNSSQMKFDYSSILQAMHETNANLHVLMDQEFELKKRRHERLLFGIDRLHAFTKNFNGTGDTALRKLVKLPKKSLDICVPLALETNGTIFTAKKLMPGNRNPLRKFAYVFAKRVAMTASPNPCQSCECTGHDTGIAYMTCSQCNINLSLDYGFGEDDDMFGRSSDADWADWNGEDGEFELDDDEDMAAEDEFE